METNTQIKWNGEKNRKLGSHRPCECGCDDRDGYKGVGYLTGSDKNGDGFTIWIEEEDVFNIVSRFLGKES